VTEIRIAPAETNRDIADIRALLEAYAEVLDVRDRCFQNMDEELADLPGSYVPPSGALLIARDQAGVAVGCIALRRLEGEVCEMKRLYVPPAGQGRGLGRRLAMAVIERARELGYRTMRLDTLYDMTAAQALYATLGFRPITPYNANPIPAVFLELQL
jgi:putative acetyltransferase